MEALFYVAYFPCDYMNIEAVFIVTLDSMKETKMTQILMLNSWNFS